MEAQLLKIQEFHINLYKKKLLDRIETRNIETTK